jgi:hypothetical protein
MARAVSDNGHMADLQDPGKIYSALHACMTSYFIKSSCQDIFTFTFHFPKEKTPASFKNY